MSCAFSIHAYENKIRLRFSFAMQQHFLSNVDGEAQEVYTLIDIQSNLLLQKLF